MKQQAGKKSFFSYENGVVTMMFFTFGLVFMDRLSVNFLFPMIAPAMHLNDAQIGLTVSILAVCWAISSIVFSGLSDHFRAKKMVLIPVLIFFSLTSFISGLVNSFIGLLVARGLMGIGEGPVLPLAQSTVAAESQPESRGFKMGFVQSSAGLFGSFLAPIVVTSVAAAYSWHMAFFIVGIPGLILAIILAKYMKEPNVSSMQAELASHKVSFKFSDYIAVLKVRNVWLSVIITSCFITWLFVFTTFAPTYLMEVDHYSLQTMGLILSAFGLGSFFWGFVVPLLSDKIGRKTALIIFALISSLSPIVLLEVHSGLALMMVLGFLVNVGQGVFPLFTSIIPAESAPPGFAATAIGLTMLVGELIGGTIMPTVAGLIGNAYGLASTMWIATIGSVLAMLVGFFLKETAPKFAAQEGSKAVVAEVV